MENDWEIICREISNYAKSSPRQENHVHPDKSAAPFYVCIVGKWVTAENENAFLNTFIVCRNSGKCPHGHFHFGYRHCIWRSPTTENCNIATNLFSAQYNSVINDILFTYIIEFPYRQLCYDRCRYSVNRENNELFHRVNSLWIYVAFITSSDVAKEWKSTQWTSFNRG